MFSTILLPPRAQFVLDTADKQQQLQLPFFGGMEEEEEEDLFVFNDTMEGPRAPALSKGASLQSSLTRVRAAPCLRW